MFEAFIGQTDFLYASSQVRIDCVAEDKIFACACVPIPLRLHVYEWRYMKLNITSSMSLTPLKWESQHTRGTSNQCNREVL